MTSSSDDEGVVNPESQIRYNTQFHNGVQHEEVAQPHRVNRRFRQHQRWNMVTGRGHGSRYRMGQSRRATYRQPTPPAFGWRFNAPLTIRPVTRDVGIDARPDELSAPATTSRATSTEQQEELQVATTSRQVPPSSPWRFSEPEFLTIPMPPSPPRMPIGMQDLEDLPQVYDTSKPPTPPPPPPSTP